MANMRYSAGRSSGSRRSDISPRREEARVRSNPPTYNRYDGRERRYEGRQESMRRNTSQRRPADVQRGNYGRMSVKRKQNNSIKWIILLGIVILGIIFCVRMFGGGGSGEERFVENVYINGVSLAGYTKDEGYAVMEEIKNNRINTEYILTCGDKKWSFIPSEVNAKLEFDDLLQQAWNFGHMGDNASRKQIIASLTITPVYLTSELTYDEEALDVYLQKIAEEIAVAPLDAEVTLTAEKPVITRQSENGLELDIEKARENLISLLETGTGDTELPVQEVIPNVSSDGLEMDIVCEFSTDVSFRGTSSTHNVRLALNYFNAMAVYPGDEISFNTVVGPRTEAAGFKKAPEYAGNETVEGVGGGVCQASTTLYNAVIRAGMEIIERNRHSMTVVYVEPSMDAAVEYGGKDFIFRNDTEHTIYIYTNVTSDTATVTIYGTKPEYRYELESIIISQEKSDRIRYEDDTSGKYVYYTTDTPVLKTEGKGSCQSQGWLVSYDWKTGEEVARKQVSNDPYSPGVNVYWRGIHTPAGLTSEY